MKFLLPNDDSEPISRSWKIAPFPQTHFRKAFAKPSTRDDMTEKKSGRPPRYSEAQVLKGIEIVEQAGEIPTGDTVKRAMCAHLAVPGGINAQSLDKEVQRLMEERSRERLEHLVAKLPPTSRMAAKEVAARFEKDLLRHFAEEHEALCAAASEKNDQLEETLSLMRRHARDDRVAIEEKDAQIADLEERKHALEERLDASLQEITSLKNRISVLEAEQDMRAQMLALMKEAFVNQGTSMT
jgi:hypothetical protein